MQEEQRIVVLLSGLSFEAAKTLVEQLPKARRFAVVKSTANLQLAAWLREKGKLVGMLETAPHELGESLHCARQIVEWVALDPSTCGFVLQQVAAARLKSEQHILRVYGSTMDLVDPAHPQAHIHTDDGLLAYLDALQAVQIQYLICSTHELKVLKRRNMKVIEPMVWGVWPDWAKGKDHHATPEEAFRAGAHHVLVNSQILTANGIRPQQAFARLVREASQSN